MSCLQEYGSRSAAVCLPSPAVLRVSNDECPGIQAYVQAVSCLHRVSVALRCKGYASAHDYRQGVVERGLHTCHEVDVSHGARDVRSAYILQLCEDTL
jgi:hypothetical protein